jgi:hypothetical protein
MGINCVVNQKTSFPNLPQFKFSCLSQQEARKPGHFAKRLVKRVEESKFQNSCLWNECMLSILKRSFRCDKQEDFPLGYLDNLSDVFVRLYII